MAQTVSFDFKNAKAMATDADIAAIKDHSAPANPSRQSLPSPISSKRT